MRSMRTFLLTATALAACGALAPPAFGAATRTWVSGVGDDINPCSRTAPCKTWAGAISRTNENGEIDALDPGGFGAITITKGITLDGNGMGSILYASTTGVIVNAGPNDDVVLRNMSVNGGYITDPAPATGCGFSGINGIRVLSAGTVRLENSSVQNFTTTGILVNPTVAAPSLIVDRSTITNGCGPAIDLAPTATGSASAFVRNSVLSNATTGLHARAASHAWITGSAITGNDTGILADGGGIIDAIDQNQLVGNGTNGVPTTNTSSAPPVVTPGPTVTNTTTTTTPGPIQVVTVTTPAPAQCIIPTLTGLTTAAATAKLTKANCAIGTVSSKTTSSKKLAGKVIGQKTEAGTTAKAGTKVNVTVGKKKKSKKRAVAKKRAAATKRAAAKHRR